MADDPKPYLPDRAELEARARQAGVNLDVLSELARIRVSREFYTAAERKALDAEAREEMAEDARRYNAYVEKYGIWNAKVRGW